MLTKQSSFADFKKRANLSIGRFSSFLIRITIRSMVVSMIWYLWYLWVSFCRIASPFLWIIGFRILWFEYIFPFGNAKQCRCVQMRGFEFWSVINSVLTSVCIIHGDFVICICFGASKSQKKNMLKNISVRAGNFEFDRLIAGLCMVCVFFLILCKHQWKFWRFFE